MMQTVRVFGVDLDTKWEVTEVSPNTLIRIEGRSKSNGREVQDRLAALSTNSQHRVANATHEGLIDDKATFEPSVLAIADVVQSIRTHEPVAIR